MDLPCRLLLRLIFTLTIITTIANAIDHPKEQQIIRHRQDFEFKEIVPHRLRNMCSKKFVAANANSMRLRAAGDGDSKGIVEFMYLSKDEHHKSVLKFFFLRVQINNQTRYICFNSKGRVKLRARYSLHGLCTFIEERTPIDQIEVEIDTSGNVTDSILKLDKNINSPIVLTNAAHRQWHLGFNKEGRLLRGKEGLENSNEQVTTVNEHHQCLQFKKMKPGRVNEKQKHPVTWLNSPN